ncbi:hypothetical protein [Oceaniradius stylonematis]|uniref:hypothetical protein n=1 Tax=Oceaniradius stylonematis TaxID=2184161 RepID=UPI00273F9537|nr:hypothetical protein [Oceaniradius stylonematis]
MDVQSLEALMRMLADQAGPVFAGLGLLGAALFWVLRSMGWAGSGERTRVVASARLDTIDDKLDGLESRLGNIEADLEDRPTRAEMHEIQTMLARLEERAQARANQMVAIQASVTRVEDFLISLSRGSK